MDIFSVLIIVFGSISCLVVIGLYVLMIIEGFRFSIRPDEDE